MTRRAAAYLRKSKEALTKADHTAALLRFVVECGDRREPTIHDDWGRSGGRSGLAKRVAYQDMMAAVERGEIDAVYALDVGRAGRDIEESLRMERTIRENGGAFWTRDDDGEPTNWSLPSNRDAFINHTHYADKEWRKASRRANSTVAMRLAREDDPRLGGQAPYGLMMVRGEGGRIEAAPNPDQPLEPLLAAIREAGSVLGACRILTAAGVPTPRPERTTIWHPHTLRRILERTAPEVLPPTSPRKRRLPITHPLSGLVTCACGDAEMTLAVGRGQLFCWRGHAQGAAEHGPYSIPERVVVEALRAETDRIRVRVIHMPVLADVRAKRAAIEAKRERLGWAVTDGLLARNVAAERASALDAELAALDSDLDAIDPEWAKNPKRPLVEWGLPDLALVNRQLRRVFTAVRLQRGVAPEGRQGLAAGRPILEVGEIEWRKPEWRRP
jgi:DNA invertase Pin-like site-specific DNA recombinase